MSAHRQLRLKQLNQQFNRTALSSSDFDEAVVYLERLRTSGDIDLVTQRGLVTAAIIAYGRPFAAYRGSLSENATSQLSVSINKLFSDQHQQLHKKLMELRHRVVAHSSYERQPVTWMHGSAAGFSWSQWPCDVLHQGIDNADWQAMCDKLRVHCFDKMNELSQEIVKLGGVSQGVPPPPPGSRGSNIAHVQILR